jgi:osmotically inducible lipoprotein OsmB
MNIKKYSVGAVSAAALLAGLTLNSCDTPTGAGAGYGAAAGAILGAAATGRLQDAAIGAAAGAATGALIGAAIEADDARRTAPPPPGGYPFARRTGTFGFVQSPYAPHRIVDVRGIPPGELVRDPSTGGVFRNP